MQKLIAIILLLAFFGQTFNQGFYYVDYLLDKAEYVERCVNKLRPEMHCEGKCLLMKKIEEQEKRAQQKAPEMKLAGKIEILPSQNWYAAFAPFHSTDVTRSYISFNDGSPIDQPSSVFHPPSA